MIKQVEKLGELEVIKVKKKKYFKRVIKVIGKKYFKKINDIK